MTPGQLHKVLPIRDAVLPREGVRSYLYKRSETHLHRGIDLPAPEGTAVYAVEAGIVRHATHAWQQGFTGYGNVVVLEHPRLGLWTLYAHLAEPLVQEGERVDAGELIGTVGRTAYTHGNHEALFSQSGAHLHFEVSPRSYPQQAEAARLDPVAFLLGDDPELRESTRPLRRPPAKPAEPSEPVSSSQSDSEHSPHSPPRKPESGEG
jgi:murein DD-endopeptidase MepM/ murein hydrolase activator NlpD